MRHRCVVFQLRGSFVPSYTHIYTPTGVFQKFEWVFCQPNFVDLLRFFLFWSFRFYRKKDTQLKVSVLFFVPILTIYTISILLCIENWPDSPCCFQVLLPAWLDLNVTSIKKRRGMHPLLKHAWRIHKHRGRRSHARWNPGITVRSRRIQQQQSFMSDYVCCYV